jgi:hypothetical protein
MNEIKNTCIFCFRSNNEIDFSKEHIIPKSIGGTLILDGYVCVECNSTLGAKVDHQILKLPEIITAFEKLKIEHNKDQIINKNYDITGKIDDNIQLRGGKVKAGKIRFPTQNLNDGSIIAPDNEIYNVLNKIIMRDKQLKNVGLSDNFIKMKFAEFLLKYNSSNKGEYTSCPELGVALLKRDDKSPNTTFEPKGNFNLLPLIAKIAYEFIFLIGGSQFFSNENQELVDQLIQSINTGKVAGGLYYSREKSNFDDYENLHFIFLEFYPHFTIVRVILFGYIQYMITGAKLSSDYIKNLEEKLNIENIFSISYQQILDNPSQSFWVNTFDGETIRVTGNN